MTTFDFKERPITMVVTGVDVLEEIEYPGRLVIESKDSLQHSRWCRKWHVDTARCLGNIFKREPKHFTPDTIKDMGSGVRSAVGFVDISLKLRDLGAPFVLRHPETGLHPTVQAEFMQFIVEELKGKTK